MVNLMHLFENCAKDLNDALRFAVIGWRDGDEAQWKSWGEIFPALPWEEAKGKIDYDYDDGFGAADCHRVIAWGNLYVYFIIEYDGTTSIGVVPRNPISCSPGWGQINA